MTDACVGCGASSPVMATSMCERCGPRCRCEEPLVTQRNVRIGSCDACLVDAGRCLECGRAHCPEHPEARESITVLGLELCRERVAEGEVTWRHVGDRVTVSAEYLVADTGYEWTIDVSDVDDDEPLLCSHGSSLEEAERRLRARALGLAGVLAALAGAP